jgi:hypothetical protein
VLRVTRLGGEFDTAGAIESEGSSGRILIQTLILFFCWSAGCVWRGLEGEGITTDSNGRQVARELRAGGGSEDGGGAMSTIKWKPKILLWGPIESDVRKFKIKCDLLVVGSVACCRVLMGSLETSLSSGRR